MTETTDTIERLVVTSDGLKDLGITFAPAYRHKLIKEGKFPPPFKLGLRLNAWWVADIVRWLEERARETTAGVEARREKASRR